MVTLGWILVCEREIQSEVFLRCLRQFRSILVDKGKSHGDQAVLDWDAEVHRATGEDLNIVHALRMESGVLALI